MRTTEKIKEYLMLNDRFPEKEKALIENALIVEKLYAKEIENGEYEYALVSDFINSPFILEDEDEVDKLIEIEQIHHIWRIFIVRSLSDALHFPQSATGQSPPEWHHP